MQTFTVKQIALMSRNKVRHIQIDAGAAFMKDFEETFKDLNLPLYCLFPSKPTYNGKIERSNRVFREEFYADPSADTIVRARKELMNFLHKYNSYRPQGLLTILRKVHDSKNN